MYKKPMTKRPLKDFIKGKNSLNIPSIFIKMDVWVFLEILDILGTSSGKQRRNSLEISFPFEKRVEMKTLFRI